MRSLLLVLLFGGICTTTVSASHMHGAELSYKYVSGNKFLVEFVLYYDCGVTNGPPAAIASIGIADNCGNFQSLTLYLRTVKSIPITACDTILYSLGCTNPFGFGLTKYTYTRNVILPATCSTYELYWEGCCMTYPANLYSVATGSDFGIKAIIDRSVYTSNSSPSFNFDPSYGFCVNQFSCYNLSVTDIDGDSIVYALESPTFKSFIPPYTASNPWASQSGFNMNAQTGILTFTPTLVGYFYMCVTAREYRNGVLLGSVSRRLSYPVTNSTSSTGTTTTYKNVSGKVYADYNNNQMQDSIEPGIQNVIVKSNSASYSVSGTDGAYRISVPTGTNTLSVLNPPIYYSVYPDTLQVTTTAICDIDTGNHFAFVPQANVLDATINLTSTSAVNPFFGVRYHVDYRNIGTTVIDSGYAQMIIDTSLEFQSANLSPDTIIGDTLTWSFKNFGLNAAQKIIVDLEFRNWQALPDSVFAKVKILPIVGDTDQVNNRDSTIQAVNHSFDPNDKEVSPDRDIDLSGGVPFLEYIVRFQNTGTDTAWYVKILDTLDADLDVGTFEMISASHDNQFSISGKGNLKWEFLNISLPDSSDDMLGSNGFIKYRIKPKSNLLIGSEITNEAHIFFDFNAPITTNSTSNFIVGASDIIENSNSDSDFIIYPNPNAGTFSIQFNEAGAEDALINIIDMMGRLVYTTTVNRRQLIEIDVQDHSNGIYFLNYSSSEVNQSSKIIISR